MKQTMQKGILAASLGVLCLLGGCSTTTDLLTQYRLINSKPYENTQAAREKHRNECLQKHGLQNRKQAEAAIPDIQASFLYCVRNTNGWYLVEAQQYDAELARINREYYSTAAYN